MKSQESQLNWEQLKRDNELFLIDKLVFSTAANHSHLPQIDLENVLLASSKPESWSYWLAVQLIEQWRCLPISDSSVQTQTVIEKLGLCVKESEEVLINVLDKTPEDASLTLELASRINSIRLQQYQRKLSPKDKLLWLDHEANKLAQWFSQLSVPSQSSQAYATRGFLAQMHANAVVVRERTQQQLQDCLIRVGNTGTKELLKWLGCLNQEFDHIYVNYDAQRQKNLELESSAWRAFYTLRGTIGAGCPNEQLVIRALEKAFDLKLKAELYAQAMHIVSELKRSVSRYSTTVSQIDVALVDLQCWLSQNTVTKPFVANLLLEQLEQMDTEQLCNRLENRWVSDLGQSGILAPHQLSEISEEILEYIRPLCKKMYIDCCNQLLA